MPVIATFRQQPNEQLDYDIDFSEWLPPNDTIISANVSATPSGLDLSYAILSQRIKVWAWSGANGITYKITVRITTNDSRIKEVEFRLRVKED